MTLSDIDQRIKLLHLEKKDVGEIKKILIKDKFKTRVGSDPSWHYVRGRIKAMEKKGVLNEVKDMPLVEKKEFVRVTGICVIRVKFEDVTKPVLFVANMHLSDKVDLTEDIAYAMRITRKDAESFVEVVVAEGAKFDVYELGTLSLRKA